MAQETQNLSSGKSSPTTGSIDKSEWPLLPEEEMPQPTYWPITMALGIVFMFWGLITTYIISGVGVVLFIIALIGWIGDVWHGE